MKTRLLYLLAFIAISFHSKAQKSFFNVASEQVELTKTSLWNRVLNLKVYKLDKEEFRNYLLQNVPKESLKAKAVPISLPFPDGSLHTFYITESAVMEEQLANKFPEIKSYKGTDGSNYLRMSISPYSFQAYILTGDGDIVIEAIDKISSNDYGVFYSKDLQMDHALPLSCGVKEFEDIKSTKDENSKKDLHYRTEAGILGLPVDLRTYRVAIACTGEWGADPNRGGGTVPSAIDKMVASLIYINAVYEKDVAIHLNLIANNDLLIYLNGSLDPYPEPTQGGGILGINTGIINAKVGIGSYDIGHVYTNNCSDVGGIAFLGCVCEGNKGGGVTCWYTTDIAYVTQRITCHEMGHQFIASHTFSNCNGNESGTAYEPGSGTTIMSYSGLCGPLNVEPGNLPHPNYFHSNSVEQIIDFTRKFGGSRCGKSTVSGNSFPDAEILIPSGLNIPIRTPFLLKGRATDMENDNLTYNWEQYDAGGYGPIIGEPKLDDEGPLFKSPFPGSNPNRVVPVWNAILNKGNFEPTEVLPTVSREINFRFNVRDNHAGAGGTAWKKTFFRSVESAGPFTVTSPNYPQTDTLFTSLCNKISWDVANTSKSLVNCQKVNIYLMPNRTIPTFLIPLLMNTENDGEELVEIPDTLVGLIRSRVLVEAADNIFFDVSDADIRIKAPTSPKLVFGVSPNSLKFCVPSKTDIAIRSCATNDIVGDVQLFVESGLPVNARYNFVKTNMGVNDQTVLQLDFSDVRSSGISILVVIAITPLGDTLRENIELDLVSVDFSDLKTIYPADGLSGLSQSIEFSWTPSKNAVSYTLEVATSPGFGNTVIYTVSGITGTTFKPNILFEENTLYFWRILPTNRCGLGQPTTPSPFHTVNKSCLEKDYPGNVISRRANQTGVMLIPIQEAGIISDVNVRSFKGFAVGVNSVSLTLVSPLGTKVKLFDNKCGVTDQFDCSFDDDATLTLINPSNACPPTLGKIIKPIESLSKFNGEDKKGDWRLEIALDNLLSGFAEFSSLTLDICSELIVNNPFLINNIGLQLNQGETKNIGQNLLLSEDNNNGPSELLYTIVIIPQRGDLLINGVVANYGSQFTQKDINDGKLSYRHNGQDHETDEFLFTVQDGMGGWFGTEAFKIQIGTVGTKNQLDVLGLNIYPNPTNGLLQIATDKMLDKSASLRIINIQGQLMLSKHLGGLKADVLNIQHLQDGVYILEIKSGKYFSVNKIVLKK